MKPHVITLYNPGAVRVYIFRGVGFPNVAVVNSLPLATTVSTMTEADARAAVDADLANGFSLVSSTPLSPFNL